MKIEFPWSDRSRSITDIHTKDALVLEVKTVIMSIAQTKIDRGHAHQGLACSAGEETKSVLQVKRGGGKVILDTVRKDGEE